MNSKILWSGEFLKFSPVFTRLFFGVLMFLGLAACQKEDVNTDPNNPNNNQPQVPISPVTNGFGATNDIFHLDINEDGRYIAITTKAKLLPADNDNFGDVYRYDRVNNQLELVSTNLNSNAFTASITADGNTILYTASQHPDVPNTPTAIYFWQNGNIQTVQEGQQDPLIPWTSFTPTVAFLNIISPDGRYIAANVDLNFFVYEIATQTNTLLGNGNPIDFSADGSVLTYLLVDILSPQTQPTVWYWDRKSGQNLPVTKSTKYSDNPKISGNGRYLVFVSEDGSFTGATDQNGLQDAFLFDIQTPKYTRLSSANANGESNHPDVSNDGSVIVFASTANSLGVQDDNLYWDIYLRINGQLRNLTNASDGHSVYPVLSGDGKYVVFVSEATDFGGNGAGNGANLFVAGPLR